MEDNKEGIKLEDEVRILKLKLRKIHLEKLLKKEQKG